MPGTGDARARIGVVDDDASLSSLLANFLTASGYDVAEGATAEAARRLVDEGVDVLLLDLWLPDGSGMELTRETAARPGRPDIIIMTGEATLESAIDAVGAGASEYLVKPFDLKRLKALVDTLLERRRRRQTRAHTTTALRSHRRLSRRRQAAQYAVGRVLVEAPTLEAAVQPLLREIAEALCFGVATLWVANPDAETLRLLDVWHGRGHDVDAFAKAGRALALPRGHGVAGRVLATVEPAWVADVDQATDLPRTGGALLEKLPQCLGFPVALGTEVLGVVELFGASLDAPDAELLEWVGSLGRQIAQFIDRKRGEARLRESEERFRATFEQAAVGMTVLANDGRFLRVNQRFCEMVGYTADELTARRFPDITHPDDVEMNVARHRTIVEDGVRTYTVEKRYLRKDGSIIWVHVTASRARRVSGMTGYSIGIVQDITERKQLEQELLHAQRMEGVGQLAEGIAHDFNNLLTVISGRSQLGFDRLSPADPLRREFDLIHKTADRAASLTRQLLAFGRKQVLQPRVVAVNDLVRSSTDLLKRLVGEHIELTFVPAAETGRVRVDPGQLGQVIVNLAVNARDAMPDGGRLTIEARNVELDAAYAARHVDVTPGPYIELAVSDTGTGMQPDVQARIFEPFFTTKGPGKGTGLGLSMVYGIMKQSGGHIRVESQPGAGATFRVYLPRTEETPETEPARSASALPGGTETVLLVEDDQEVRELAHEMLERLGYSVLDAPAPGDAILIAQNFVGIIDLLLTDIVMPRMSGRALAELIVAERPETRVLFMSGYTDDLIAQHGVLEPGTDLLQKPFAAQTLARTVREILDRP